MGQGIGKLGLASACAALAMIIPAPAAVASGCPNRNTPANAASLAQMRTAVDCLINQQRTERGLPPLSVSSKLDTVAERWSSSMVAHGQFSHARFVARVDAVHYDWRVAEENIATGYPTPSQTVAAWMASPDHCHNLLDPSIRNVGTGERAAPVRGWASGPATWTQDFGLTMGQPPPSHDHGPANRCPYR
jgi:uncharacterized protein YkwD